MKKLSNPAPNEDVIPDLIIPPLNDIKSIIIRILNVFENDDNNPNTEYDKIYIYNDGTNKVKQVTLARGYTECGGALWQVFNYYKQLGGQNADQLLKFKNDSCKGVLPKNQDFLKLIIQSARQEQAMKDAQDKTFDDLYWDKGYNYYNNNGFKLNLSLAVIEDSQLHSGGMLKFLVNKIKEDKPSDGGDEKKWITAYLKARFTWLSNASELLQHTIYRPKFFLTQIDKDNWDMNCPLYPEGVQIC